MVKKLTERKDVRTMIARKSRCDLWRRKRVLGMIRGRKGAARPRKPAKVYKLGKYVLLDCGVGGMVDGEEEEGGRFEITMLMTS